MTVRQVKAAIEAGAVVIDLRTAQAFAAGHLPGAVNVRYNPSNLAARAAGALPRDLSVVLHAETRAEAATAATLVGAAGLQVLGWLEGGLDAWEAAGHPLETMPALTADELHARLGEWLVLDAREEAEYRDGHVPGALDLPWTDVWRLWRSVPGDRPVAVICRTDARSGIAASILRRMGRDARIVLGGMVGWSERGYPTEKGGA